MISSFAVVAVTYVAPFVAVAGFLVGWCAMLFWGIHCWWRYAKACDKLRGACARHGVKCPRLPRLVFSSISDMHHRIRVPAKADHADVREVKEAVKELRALGSPGEMKAQGLVNSLCLIAGTVVVGVAVWLAEWGIRELLGWPC